MTGEREWEGYGRLVQGDCLTALRAIPPSAFSVVVTDPPYPNNAGHFTDGIPAAEEFLRSVAVPALVFWSELTDPPVPLPLVAVHIWHRTNVNGRPYEPVYQFNADGRKRRSEVAREAVPFINCTGGAYAGHPTQKPIALMEWLLTKHTKPGDVVLDPFAGVGATLIACVNTGRHFVGVEIDEGYCDIAAARIDAAIRARQPALALETA
jgi:DNA modification methylase